jgi:hypothetical protein
MLYQRLEALVGPFTVEDAAEERLVEGARMTALSVSDQHAWMVTRDYEDEGTGVEIPSGKVFYAHVEGRAARPVPAHMRASFADPLSIHAASDFSPVVYTENGKAYVHGAEPGGTVVAVGWPLEANLSSASLEGFPETLLAPATYYAAHLVEWARAQRTEIPALLDVPEPPVAPVLAPLESTTLFPELAAAVEIDPLPSLPAFTLPALLVPEPPEDLFDKWEPYYAQEDAEIMGEALGRARVEIERYTNELQGRVQGYASRIQGETARFQAETEAYRAEIEKNMQQARLSQERLLTSAAQTDNMRQANAARQLQAEVSTYEQAILRYKEEVMSYQASVQARLAERTQVIEREAQVRAKHMEQSQQLAQLFQQSMQPYL